MLRVVFSILVLVSCVWAQSGAQTYQSIRPGQPWLDTDGKPIQAHAPQIFFKDGVYYWYGENKQHTTLGSNVWTWGVRAYRSTDFCNWQDMGLIIEPDTVNPLSPLHYSQTLDRPHILYNKNTGKWVCWIKSMDTDGFFIILQADRFEGPYSIVRSLKPEGFGVGDFDLWADSATGKAYVWFERPHWELICAELTDDYLATNGHYSEHFVGLRPPYTREAPSHFVYNGRHYMFTSGTTGYVPNPSRVCVFDDPHGEYTDLGCPHIDDKFDDSFGSQIASVIAIENCGTATTYVALADRWLPHLAGTDIPVRTVKNYAERYKDHQPYAPDFTTPQVKDKTTARRTKWDTTVDARYVFLPILFDEQGKPTIEWREEWRLEDYTIPTRQNVGPQTMTSEIAPISAPFEMPQLQRPAISSGKKIEVRMSKRGMSTRAIQQAIDRASKLGGGVVVIPAGQWLSGRIELKSNVELHLSEGCNLHFSGLINDYLPAVFTRDEGFEVISLGAFIYANGARNIAITGSGRIVGPSTDCEIYRINNERAINIEKIVTPDMPLSERIFDGKQHQGELFLPKSIAPINCRNVLIEGITIDQGLYWNVVPQYCDSVIIRGVTVRSFGHGRTDGIDIESTRNVLIEYCSLDCQDDCYTMKSGRNIEGVRIGRPTENVVIRHCVALRGAGGLVCGTEVAGGVRNVYMHDCEFNGTDQAFRFKTLRPRGGGIENIFVERVHANVKHYAFYCDMLGSLKWGGELAKRFPSEEAPLSPLFSNITISDVVIDSCQQFIHAIGLPERPLRNVLLSNISGHADKFMRLRDVNSFVLQNVNIYTSNDEARIDGCNGIMLLDTNVNSLPATHITYEGEPSPPVIIKN